MASGCIKGQGPAYLSAGQFQSKQSAVDSLHALGDRVPLTVCVCFAIMPSETSAGLHVLYSVYFSAR